MQLRALVHDGLEELHTILAAEWRKPTYHLVDETRQAPPIHIGPMPNLLDDLRGKVLWGTADGGGAFFVLKDLGESEVRKFDVSVLVDDHILRLEAECCDAYSRYMTLCLCNASRASTICAA